MPIKLQAFNEKEFGKKLAEHLQKGPFPKKNLVLKKTLSAYAVSKRKWQYRGEMEQTLEEKLSHACVPFNCTSSES